MFTPAVQLLILCNVAVYLAENLLGLRWIGMLALWPLGPQFHPWQMVTYAFIHGGLAHIAFNMLGLAVFGTDLERVWGSLRLINCYLLSVLAAAATQLLFSAATGSTGPTIGASGGVFGLLLAFAMLFPQRQIVLLFPPIPMPAWVFALGYAVLELALGVTGTEAGVAHFAHLGGMLGAYLYITASRRRWL
jgi:membrane associated rhomboid family serine protease